ncbi:uncharacterized protein VTP21DRAFT_1593 [Calcarisporiella thermophila]|uniref:uncharacterized protein n=1 Tax=Calcarisporiella thermophila TaxID=911321 RepID=UPI00374281B6
MVTRYLLATTKEVAKPIPAQYATRGKEFSYTIDSSTFAVSTSGFGSSNVIQQRPSTVLNLTLSLSPDGSQPPPAWLNFDKGLWTMEGTPPPDAYSFTAYILAAGAVTNTLVIPFQLIVNNHPPPKIIRQPSDQMVFFGQYVQFAIANGDIVTDFGGGNLLYTAAYEARWLNFQAENLIFRGIAPLPDVSGQAQNFSIILTAKDIYKGSTSVQFRVLILPDPKGDSIPIGAGLNPFPTRAPPNNAATSTLPTSTTFQQQQDQQIGSLPLAIVVALTVASVIAVTLIGVVFCAYTYQMTTILVFHRFLTLIQHEISGIQACLCRVAEIQVEKVNCLWPTLTSILFLIPRVPNTAILYTFHIIVIITRQDGMITGGDTPYMESHIQASIDWILSHIDNIGIAWTCFLQIVTGNALSSLANHIKRASIYPFRLYILNLRLNLGLTMRIACNNVKKLGQIITTKSLTISIASIFGALRLVLLPN